MANKSEQLEQVVSSPEVRTIRLLQNKYGEKRDSVLAEVGETKSGLFWKLESGNFVPKDHEGLGWEWADLGPTPFGGRIDSLSSTTPTGANLSTPDITGSRILADITAKHIVRIADITGGYNWCLFLWHCPV